MSDWKTTPSGAKRNKKWYIKKYLLGWHLYNASNEGYGPYKTEEEALAKWKKVK